MPTQITQTRLNQLKFDFTREPDSAELSQRLILAYLAEGKKEEARNIYHRHASFLAKQGLPISETLQETGLFLFETREVKIPRSAYHRSGTGWAVALLMGTLCLWMLPKLERSRVALPLDAPKPLSVTLMRQGEMVPFADSLVLAGTEAYHKGNYPQAFSFHYGALALYEAWNHKDGQGHTLLGLGEVFQSQGELEQAEKCYQQAWRLRQNHPDPLVRANMLDLQAGLNRIMGNTDKSRAQLQECLQIRQRYGDKGGVASGYLDMAELELLQKNLASAEHYQDLALHEATALQLTPLEAAIWMSQARLALLRKDFRQAHTKMEAARAFWVQQKHPRWIAGSLLLASRIANASGNSKEGEALALQSRQAYEAVGDRYGAMNATIQQILSLRQQHRDADVIPLVESVQHYAKEHHAPLLLSAL